MSLKAVGGELMRAKIASEKTSFVTASLQLDETRSF
jgi:hypothetical protein